jgi:diguanylate cyclase (GGDEF)-like protein
MIALDAWPRNVRIFRRITIQIIGAVFASAFLTSVTIVLFVGVGANGTVTAAELWQIALPVAPIPPLICLLIAFRMSKPAEDLRQMYEELLDLALKDSLTELLNRRGFDAAAAQVFAEARRLGQPISALMCDVDMLKALNDKYGHEAGDLALRTVAQTIRESIGDRDAVLGRPGGDEFLILLPDVDIEEAAEIAEGLRKACEACELAQQDRAAQFTISAGAGTESAGASDLRALLRRSDAALYRAKRAGGNMIVCAPTPSGRRESILDIQSSTTQSAKLVAAARLASASENGGRRNPLHILFA